MNINNEQDLINGTNIPKPRIRNDKETDEEYVEYLKNYYNTYFPEEKEVVQSKEVNSQEQLQNPTIEEAPVVETEITEHDISNIQNNLESYADSIIASEQQSNNREPKQKQTINFDLNATQPITNPKSENSEQQEEIYGFNFDVNNDAPQINFDLSGIPETEVEEIKDSNEVLNKKVRSFELFTKAKAFFTSVKNKISQNVEDYLCGFGNSFGEEDLAIENGMTR